MITRLHPLTARVGLFAVAHAAYWEQFPGLYESLCGYHNQLRRKLEGFGVTVVDYGIIDSNILAYETAAKMRADGLDLLFCNMITYATSSVFAPIVRDSGLPVVLVALQPRAHLDYSQANTFMQLENDSICSVPEFTGVALRLGRRVSDVVIGMLKEDPRADAELADWCAVARVLHDLRGARFGLMGHVLDTMYDMQTDPTAICAAFGVHVQPLEIGALEQTYAAVTAQEIAQREALILQEFDTPDPKSDPLTTKLTQADLTAAAHTSVALDHFVQQYRLSGFAYYYEGLNGSIQRKIAQTLIVGNSLLNGQGIPMCGEFDLKTCVGMFLMDRLDIGGSFAEFHPFDFSDNCILVGHDGPHHIRIADGRPVLRSLTKYHGKPGHGASVEFKIREGDITILGVTQTADGRIKLITAEGESRKGAIPPTGNTNTRGHFGADIRTFLHNWVMEGPTHHFAVGIGHRAATIAKLADVLGLECTIVK